MSVSNESVTNRHARRTAPAASHAMLWSLFYNAAIYALGLATGILSARILGPDDRGLLGVVLFWPQLLGSLAAISLSDAMVVRNNGDRRDDLAAAYRIALLVALAAAPVGVFIVWQATAKYDAVIVTLALVVFVVQLFELCLEQVSQGTLRLDRRFSALNGLRVVIPVVYLVGICAASVASIGVAGFAGAYVAALVVAGILRLTLSPPPLGQPSREATKTLFRSGLAFHASAVVALLAGQLDKLIVVQTLPAAGIATYLIATSAAGPFQGFLSIAIKSVALPGIVTAPTASRPRAILRLLRATTLVSILGALAVMAVAPFVVRFLFGAPFAEAGDVAAVLTLALAPAPVRQALAEICKAYGDATRPAVAEIVFIVALLAGYFAASALGMSWPIVPAVAFANVIASVVLAAQVHRKVPSLRLCDWLIPGREVFADGLDVAKSVLSRRARSAR